MLKAIRSSYQTLVLAWVLTLTILACFIAIKPPTAYAAEQPDTVFVDDDYTVASCDGHTWNVDAFSSLREGINAVADNGTVNVAAGTYTEAGEIQVTRSMTIRGGNYWDGDTYIENTYVSVTPPDLLSHCDTIFWVHDCKDVFISGFTLDRSVETGGVDTPTSQTGVVFTGGCDFNGSKVSDCKVTGKRLVPDNDNVYSAFLALNFADNITFEHNIVEGVVNAEEFGDAYYYDGGLGATWGCEGIVIRGNYVDGLGTAGSPRGGCGVACLAASEVTIEDNVTAGTWCGVYENQCDLTITGNEIYDNDIGVQCGAWTMELHQNAIYNNGYNISCGYTEAEQVDATGNYWGIFDEDLIKASCDGNVAVFPWATDDERDEDGNFKYLSLFTYSYADGKATLTGYSGSAAHVYIPATTVYEGVSYPVTAIGDGVFENNLTLKEIDIPDSIISIGDSAFKGSTLESVDIPDSVNDIGAHAFEDCTALADITISQNVSELKESIFNNTAITSITIPDSVTVIGEAAFAFCQNLESVTIPGSVRTIADGTSSIFYGAFSDCENLKSVVIEAGDLQKIGDWAFTYCLSLESVSLPDNITWIGDCAFNTTVIKTLDLPDNLITIGEQAFSDNDVIESVEIPASVTSIGIWAFTSNDNMRDAYFFGNAPSIDNTDWPTYDPIPFGADVTVHYIYGQTGFGYNDDNNLDHDASKWYGSPTAIFVPVYFSLNGASGEMPERQLLEPGEKVVQPDDPLRQGYKFTGWYTDMLGVNAWDFDAAVTDTTGALTLYAGWKAPSGSGHDSGNGTGAGSGAAVIVNGETQTAGTLETTGTDADGRSVTAVIVDTDKLNQILKSKGQGATVTIPITGGSDVAAGVLTGAMVDGMENRDAILVLQTDSAIYTLPAAEIDINAMAAQFGPDVDLAAITVRVEISEPTEQIAQVVANTAENGGFTLVVPALDFSVSCTYNGRTVYVDGFSAYVERLIAIPDGVDPNQITTGVVVKPDGTTYHVPTAVVMIDGKYYARINSLTNSTYAVIWHPLTFADMEGHWAQEVVNNMGARMVVFGVDGNNYEPERAVTRAEFSAIIVRALGLEPQGLTNFQDVNSSDWYCGYVATAASYGIIDGYNTSAFGPNDLITREQAMVMLARAMNMTGLTVNLTQDEISALLTTCSDGAAVSAYAQQGIAACLKTGIVAGRNNGALEPQDKVTRAEVAAMVERLLQESELI